MTDSEGVGVGCRRASQGASIMWPHNVLHITKSDSGGGKRRVNFRTISIFCIIKPSLNLPMNEKNTTILFAHVFFFRINSTANKELKNNNCKNHVWSNENCLFFICFGEEYLKHASSKVRVCTGAVFGTFSPRAT